MEKQRTSIKGLTRTQLTLLIYIERKGIQRIKTLSYILEIDQADVRKNLKVLINLGLIEVYDNNNKIKEYTTTSRI